MDSAGATRGFIFDSTITAGGGVEFATTEDGQVMTATGAAVTGVQSTDQLFFELWARCAITMAGFYNVTYWFNGATDVTATTTADAASYIETPQDNLFGGGTPAATSLPPLRRTHPSRFPQLRR